MELRTVLESEERRREVFVLVMVCIFMSWQFTKLSDYGNYYFGSRFLLEGKFNASVYDPWTFNQMIEQEGTKGLYENYTPVPPFSAVFYVPFAILPALVSKSLFNIVGLLVLALGMLRCSDLFGRNGIATLIMVLFLPLKTNLDAGQTYLLLIGMLLLGWRFYHDKKYWWAALLWGICIHLKISPAIIFVFLLLEKDWKMLGWLLLSVATLFVITLPVIEFSLWKTYVVEILPRLSDNEVNDPFTSFAQTPVTFLRQLFYRDALLNPDAPMPDMELFRWLSAAVNVVLLFGAVLVAAAKNVRPFTKFSFWFFTGMLVSGYSTGYGIFILLLPLIAMRVELPDNRKFVFFAALIAISTFLPVYFWQTHSWLFRFSRLWLMLLAWVSMIVLLRPHFRIQVAGILICLLPLLRLFQQEQADASSYLLGEEAVLLTGDYQWQNDSLVLKIKNFRGDSVYGLKMTGYAADDPKLLVRDNQLFYDNRQLTFTPDRKKKPQLMSTGDIVYLSDKNRGVGFYTLRVLPFRK